MSPCGGCWTCCRPPPGDRPPSPAAARPNALLPRLPEEVVERREFQEYLEIQLNRLPRGPAVALLYHDVEGMTYREVAGLFHNSEDQCLRQEEARRWVHLARAWLAGVLVRDGWVDVPPPGRLFRPGAAPSRETRRAWMARARERAAVRQRSVLGARCSAGQRPVLPQPSTEHRAPSGGTTSMTPREVSPGASKRWELRIGATVYATDEVLGKLRQVVVSPGEQKVAGLVVRGGLPPEEYLIPIEAIQQADEEQIQLSWSLEQARARGRYDTARFHTPERSLAGYAPGKVENLGIVAGAGLARLSGSVATAAERRAAVAAARQVPGVWQVRDELEDEEDDE
jgi:BON domain/PRC-barrel domain